MTEKLKLNMSFVKWYEDFIIDLYEKNHDLEEIEKRALTGNLINDIEKNFMNMCYYKNDDGVGLFPKLKQGYAYNIERNQLSDGTRMINIGYAHTNYEVLYKDDISINMFLKFKNRMIYHRRNEYEDSIIKMFENLLMEMQEYYKQHEIGMI